jgi:hypothetical protein
VKPPERRFAIAEEIYSTVAYLKFPLLGSRSRDILCRAELVAAAIHGRAAVFDPYEMKAATDLLKLDAEAHAKNWRPISPNGGTAATRRHIGAARSTPQSIERIGAFSGVTREIYGDVEIALKMSPLSESSSPDC